MFKTIFNLELCPKAARQSTSGVFISGVGDGRPAAWTGKPYENPGLVSVLGFLTTPPPHPESMPSAVTVSVRKRTQVPPPALALSPPHPVRGMGTGPGDSGREPVASVNKNYICKQ